MTSSNNTDELGYPDRTFQTELLPCEAGSSVTFSEAGPSRSSPPREPFFKAAPSISSPTTRTSLNVAASHLRSGQLVSFPSETVYGLGANALSQTAAAKIYAAKKRPADNPLIVHVSDLHMLQTLLPTGYKMSAAYRALINSFWPGALTLLFPVDTDDPAVPSVVTCGQRTVAVRMPSHPIARALISIAGLPMAGPSANASGRPSPTTAGHVMRDLGGELDGGGGRLKYILDGGPCAVGVESTVVDGISVEDEVRVLRPGGVTVEQIRAVLKEAGLEGTVKLRVYGKDLERSKEQESNPTTPGMKYRHYSPSAKVVMVLSAELFAKALQAAPISSSSQVVESLVDASTTPASAQSFAGIVRDQLFSKPSAGSKINVGLMMTSDSALSRLISSSTPTTSTISDKAHPHLLSPITLERLEGVTVHPFDLGPSANAEVYAQRMFDGLRTLDEGPLRGEGGEKCELIFVEALDDAGVGLAVMNRLKKAASATVVLDC